MHTSLSSILSQYISKDMSPQEYIYDDLVMFIKEFVSVFPQLKDKITVDDIKDLRAYEISSKLKDMATECYKQFEIDTIDNFK